MAVSKVIFFKARTDRSKYHSILTERAEMLTAKPSLSQRVCKHHRLLPL